MTRRILAVAMLLVAGACAAALAAFPAPSLTLDTSFSPPSGVTRDDIVDTSPPTGSLPRASAVSGDRIYTVGQSNTGSAGDTAVIARRSNGILDTSFSEDGRLQTPAAGAGVEDSGVDVVVLPDGRLRILSSLGTGSTRDGAIVGLNADGSPDLAFGAADGVADGIVTFQGAYAGNSPVSPAIPRSIALADDGRLAVTGTSGKNANDDLFVVMLNADGTPLATFGSNGAVLLDRSGAATADTGVDLVFRPGGGIVVLGQLGPSSSGSAFLRAFSDLGVADPAFSDDGDLVLEVGEPPTIPTAMLLHDGRLWMTGSTRSAADTNAFLARVGADGAGAQSRQFDMRGQLVDASVAVTSVGTALAVAPGTPPTLVVGGSVSTSTTDWAAAAFNNLEGDLAALAFGDVAIDVPQGLTDGITAISAGADGWVAVAGPYRDTVSTPSSSSTYTRFGQAKLLIDAEKRCNLGLAVTRPLELSVAPNGSAPLELRIINNGTKACGGTITVPAPYAITDAAGAAGPVAVPVLPPGDSFTTTGLQIGHAGALARQGRVTFTLTAPGDSDTSDNTRNLSVRFTYCDLAVRAASRPSFVPSEGTRRFAMTLRNTGTIACPRVRVAVGGDGLRRKGGRRYQVVSGRSVADLVPAGLRERTKVGTRVRITFRARKAGDPTPGNDRVTLRPRVVAVGDTEATEPRGRARVLTGIALPGRGPVKRQARLRVTGVDVAVRRIGASCRWLSSDEGTFRTRPTAKGKPCRPLWRRAEGTRRWSLPTGGLPAGRYQLRSRATIGLGFREARFTSRDHNVVDFRVS